jgi:hypothetical protein
MAAYLTIPDVTDAEELVAYDQHQPHLVDITLHSGPTAVWLFNAAAHGSYVPLMVLTLEGSGIVALDEVVVASGQVSSAASDLMMFSLSANSVRFV